jgi:hypothetical protein
MRTWQVQELAVFGKEGDLKQHRRKQGIEGSMPVPMGISHDARQARERYSVHRLVSLQACGELSLWLNHGKPYHGSLCRCTMATGFMTRAQ